ncbi:hypothetical protein C922_04419 [Plasmodium inui San Antonio 1]|uniref:Tryptophan/threonine-rich plasmodium antigen C-terminal domain-containing protein n=1 Tax=Plasmodium inui San Antonio 1 TaxID=1237626 RepID=W7A1D1_9APIC|nr:hypothetical protein C922_04419 [Plasmodium inui San Antonio 1]EUD65133.1 hypothetical protein C922_04419 [Plasmodium inui San Antonio 1]
MTYTPEIKQSNKLLYKFHRSNKWKKTKLLHKINLNRIENEDEINLNTLLPGSLEELDKEGVYCISEWKEKKWSEFMKSIEKGFKGFMVYLEKEKNSWLEGRNKLWEEWKVNMEKKWDHYDEITFKELLSTKADDALKWTDKEWTDWVNKYGRIAWTGAWKEWVNEQDLIFKQGIERDWNNWTDFQENKFGSIQWKFLETFGWKYWKNHADPDDPLFPIKMEKMNKWQDRVKKEEEEWSKWLEEKRTEHIDVEWDKWVEWKKENNKKFIDWMEAFVEKWINNKQWTVWIEEKKGPVTI